MSVSVPLVRYKTLKTSHEMIVLKNFNAFRGEVFETISQHFISIHIKPYLSKVYSILKIN